MDEDHSQPILPGRGNSDYERYLRTDELLALQKTPAEMGHRDELLFQTVHQSSELWLKLACFEVETATAQLERGSVPAAVRLLRRANDAIELVTAHLHMLDHLSPWDYQGVRRQLGHGAGFDSPGFRQVHHSSPALGQAFMALLDAHGLSVVDLYVRAAEFEDLYQAAEQLITWDEQVALWKYHHFLLVQRIIGAEVIGTQGTPVEVLGRRLDQKFFPFLWDARNELTELGTKDREPGTRNPAGAGG